MKNAEYWIKKLSLTEHPEGGYFRETYRSGISVDRDALPEYYRGPRVFSTLIYFLVTHQRPSRFHRLQSDEVWHFYEGSPLIIYSILNDGSIEIQTLGKNPDKSETFQAVIKGGTWFAAKIRNKNGYALCGCQVSPGFEYPDFEVANTEKLIKAFPQRKDVILKINGKIENDFY